MSKNKLKSRDTMLRKLLENDNLRTSDQVQRERGIDVDERVRI